MKRSTSVTLCEGGGVLILRDQEILGVWRWTGNFFRFSKTVDGPAEFEAQTLMGASFYTSHLLLE
jgi:hypothetical protein